MAFFFGDGFDLYAALADGVGGYWDGTSLNPNSSGLVAGRFTGSRCVNMSSSTRLDKVSGANDAMHKFVVAFQQSSVISGTTNGFFITLFDGATAQCSVVFRTDGVILLVAGIVTGAILAVYTGAFTAPSVWYAFEIEVVVNNTTGSIAVRRNGNPINDYFLGSLPTRASANNYANKLQIGSYSAATHYVDDFLWRSDAASVPWIGDIRCHTRRPINDVSTQFSHTTAAFNQVIWNGVNVQQNYGANVAVYVQFTSPCSGLITGMFFGPSSNGGTGHIKVALFSSIGNVVGSVLAVATEITNPAIGFTVTFPTPARIIAGQSYWLGVINDTGNISLNVVNSPAGVTGIMSQSTTYASWPVSNPSAAISSGNVAGLTLIFTPQQNSDAVGELYQDVFTSYVYSSTNGQADFYTISSIAGTPFTVFGVTTRGLFTKSDAGTRNASVQLKSGATTVQGASTALNTAAWGWVARNDLVDPATGAPWAALAVNSVNIGPVVTA